MSGYTIYKTRWSRWEETRWKAKDDGVTRIKDFSLALDAPFVEETNAFLIMKRAPPCNWGWLFWSGEDDPRQRPPPPPSFSGNLQNHTDIINETLIAANPQFIEALKNLL
ncbi:hypothetical protein LOK49_LG13G00286 [Camellia lanceoleosa]|uniref:Uncharacterized protein n=1 Tax=Camellia lanceoleosa TaxID=1840588 RepID=A0ACC0FGC6_9ERIC|nr:hypothetical protein LOK49_LG13G00286 [Camellia lanceoleosa]